MHMYILGERLRQYLSLSAFEVVASIEYAIASPCCAGQLPRTSSTSKALILPTPTPSSLQRGRGREEGIAL